MIEPGNQTVIAIEDTIVIENKYFLENSIIIEMIKYIYILIYQKDYILILFYLICYQYGNHKCLERTQIYT